MIEAWLKQPGAPGHALLIDGPWGCGKTHTVKAILQGMDDYEALYVSLFGATSVEDIHRAILTARWPESDIINAPWFKAGMHGLKAATGGIVDLGGLGLQNMALKNLPDILVFDDLERTEMPLRSLFGALNRFVEHEGKSVLLIAHEAELAKHEDYAKEREKIIGRTVRLKADAEQALPGLWDNCGAAKGFYHKHQADILEVFEAAETHSLRVLRQSLREFARVYAALSGEVLEHQTGMRAFLRCYLVLSLAFNAGNLSREEVASRDEIKAFYNFDGDQNRKVMRLGALQEALPDGGVYAEGSVISLRLGVALILDAIVPNWINEALQQTAAFAGNASEGTPDWQILFSWGFTPACEIEAALARMDAAMASFALIVPGEIAQVAGARANMAKNGAIACAPADIWKEATAYVEALLARGLLPPREHGHNGEEGGYGWDIRDGSFSFAGYAFSLDAENTAFLKTLKAAQNAALAKAQIDETRRVADLIRKDVKEVLLRLEGKHAEDWRRTSLWLYCDADAIAAALGDAWAESPSTCKDILETMNERWLARPEDLSAEREWGQQFREALEAVNASAVLKAQIALACRSLSALDTHYPPSNPAGPLADGAV